MQFIVIFLFLGLVTTKTASTYPVPTCRGQCTTATTIPSIGQKTAWVGNGDIEITIGYSQNNFVSVKLPFVIDWVQSLLYPTVDRSETYNVTAIFQYNGILEPYVMHSLPDDLVPHTADILGNILSQLIIDDEIVPIGDMLTAFWNTHKRLLLADYVPSTLTFVSQDIGGKGEQTFGIPYFGNIRPLSVNQVTFAKCKIKMPPAPGAYNGWAPASTPPTNFSPSSTYTCADFVKQYIALANCNVSIPYQNGEGWTPFFFASCLQSYGLNLINADGTSALNTPAAINFLDTVLKPMLLASRTGTEYMVNASSPSMKAYLSTPESEWDPFATFPLGMMTTLIPATTPQGMAELTGAKPPAVTQCYTPDNVGPNYVWVLTVSSRAPPLQQYLGFDWLRYNALIVQQSSNVSAPVQLTPLGQSYLAANRLPYMISGRTSPPFVALINKTPNLQIVQDVNTKGISLSAPSAPTSWEARSIAEGVYNGLFACLGLKNLSSAYCANRTSVLMNFLNLRPCLSSNPGDIEYIKIQNPGQDVCSGVYFTSYARWNTSRINKTCTIQYQSTMTGVTLVTTSFVPPRTLLDGDALILSNETFEAVFTLISVIIHICAFLLAMTNIDIYVTSLESYFKLELVRVDFRSLFIASIFLGTGVWIQSEGTCIPIELKANVCGVTGQASVQFWAGLQVAQLFINIAFSIISTLVAQYALRLLLAAKHDTSVTQAIQVNGQMSVKKSDNALVNVTVQQNISSFDMNQSDQRQDKIKHFMAELVDTRWSWCMFFVSGSIQSANMILAYWIGLQTIELSSDFTSTLPSYILVVEWLGGTFFLGLANYAVFRLYGSPYARYAIASVLPLCIVFIQWINLVASTFKFKSMTTLPPTTWISTYAGILVGVFCLAAIVVFLHNSKHVSMSEKDHAIKKWGDNANRKMKEQGDELRAIGSTTTRAHRDKLANKAFETDLKKANLITFWRPYKLSILFSKYVAGQKLPVHLTNKPEVTYWAPPTLKMLQTPMKEIMAPKELFNRYATKLPADTAPKMFDHPLAGECFRQLLTEQKSPENYQFLEEVNDYKEMHKRGLDPSTSYMIAKAMYLTWFKSIDGVSFQDLELYVLLPSREETKETGSMFDKKEPSKEKGKPTNPFLGVGSERVNVSGDLINEVYTRLCVREAPVDLFDKTYAELLTKVVNPLSSNVMAVAGFENINHQFNLPCVPQNTQPSVMVTEQLPNSPVRESRAQTNSTSSPLLNGIKSSDVYRHSPQMSVHHLSVDAPATLPGTVESS